MQGAGIVHPQNNLSCTGVPFHPALHPVIQSLSTVHFLLLWKHIRPPWRVCWSSELGCPSQDAGMKFASHAQVRRVGFQSQHGCMVLLVSRTLGAESPPSPATRPAEFCTSGNMACPGYICSCLKAVKAVIAWEGRRAVTRFHPGKRKTLQTCPEPLSAQCHAPSSILLCPVLGAICISCPPHCYGITFLGCFR